MPPAPQLLIVDDDPERRNFLATEMAVEGYSCEETATDQQALSKIRGHERDLVLLDWTQPARGFTLVELMIVVAIVGLLSAVALPAYLRSRAAGLIAALAQFQQGLPRLQHRQRGDQLQLFRQIKSVFIIIWK